MHQGRSFGAHLPLKLLVESWPVIKRLLVQCSNGALIVAVLKTLNAKFVPGPSILLVVVAQSGNKDYNDLAIEFLNLL